MNAFTPLLSALPSSSFEEVLQVLFAVLLGCLFIGGPLALLSWAAYGLLSLPMRRQERARFFLHLLENCLRQGQPLEAAFIEMANVRDRSPGVQFHLFAAHLEEGDRFADALRKVPGLLPPPVTALLHAGLELGDLRAVLPACRMQLHDARSSLSGMLNYFLVFAVGLAPMALLLLNLLTIYVLPKYKEIAEGMFEGAALPAGLRFVLDGFHLGMAAEAALFLVVLVVLIAYAGGPGLTSHLRWKGFPLLDWLAWRVPWKRKRMQRNFAAALSLLLDHGVPEATALRLAADCTVNEIFRHRAARAIAGLAQGKPLAEAVQALDPAGEFRWRLTNGVHGHGGFVGALRGWLESLDAKAFQQEQAAAQVFSTALVVFNGVIVGCVCAGVFGLLTQFIRIGTLW